MRTVKKYFYLYFLFMKNNISVQAEYRTNLFMQIISEIMSLLSRLLFVWVILEAGLVFPGFPKEYIILYMGTYFILTAIYVFCFVNNFWAFQQYIRTGTLDIYMTKPVSTQFFVSFRLVNFGMAIPDFILGVVMVLYFILANSVLIMGINLIKYVLLIFSGSVLTYSLFMAIQILAFWFINNENLYNLGETLWENNGIPMNIYTKKIQTIGITLIPIFIIANFPAMALADKLSMQWFLGALLLSVISIFLIRLFFNMGIKRYTSAN